MRKLLWLIALLALGYVVWFVALNTGTRSPSSPKRVPAPAAPPPSTPAAGEGSEADIAALIAKRLTIPVVGVQPAQIADTWGQSRDDGARAHQAVDILAKRGTEVVAVEDGRIEKLFNSERGGITIYQFDPSQTYIYYYAHLDRYADGLAEGQAVKRGQVIGYVGFTGDAVESAPHLHFGIERLGPDRKWWEGVSINPYRPLRGNQLPGD